MSWKLPGQCRATSPSHFKDWKGSLVHSGARRNRKASRSLWVSVFVFILHCLPDSTEHVSWLLANQPHGSCLLALTVTFAFWSAPHLPRAKALWLRHALVLLKPFLVGTARPEESPKGAEPAHLHVPEQRKPGWESKGLIYFLFHFVWLKQSGVRISDIWRKAIEYKWSCFIGQGPGNIAFLCNLFSERSPWWANYHFIAASGILCISTVFNTQIT